jgi:hypothetical protein
MSGLPHGGVVHAEVAANRADDDFTRVEADANVDRQALGTLDILGVRLHGLLHAERRVAGPDGVILVGKRRAEQRHDPVAHDLVHGPLVAMDRFHHPLEHRIENAASVFRIAVGK